MPPESCSLRYRIYVVLQHPFSENLSFIQWFISSRLCETLLYHSPFANESDYLAILP